MEISLFREGKSKCSEKNFFKIFFSLFNFFRFKKLNLQHFEEFFALYKNKLIKILI